MSPTRALTRRTLLCVLLVPVLGAAIASRAAVPVINLRPPDRTYAVEGTNVLLTVEARDSDGTVDFVEFRTNGTVMAVIPAPWNYQSMIQVFCTWTNPPVGDHVLSARAVDKQGLSSSWATANLFIVPNFSPTDPVANDYFSNRTHFAGPHFVAVGSTINATNEPSEPKWTRAIAGRSVWWSWTAPTNGVLSLALHGLGFVPAVQFFSGSVLGNLDPLPLRHGFVYTWNLKDYSRELSCQVRAGLTLQIVLDGSQEPTQITVDGVPIYPPPGGTFRGEFSFTPAPSNDDFANRELLNGTDIIIPGSSRGATRESLDPQLPGYPFGSTVWWSWISGADGPVRFSVVNSNINYAMAVFTGAALSNLVLVATNQSLPTCPMCLPNPYLDQTLIFQARAGWEYIMAVDANVPPHVAMLDGREFILNLRVLPSIRQISSSSGDWLLRVDAVPNRNCNLQFSSDFRQWEVITQWVSSGTDTLRVPARAPPVGFFRVWSQNP